MKILVDMNLSPKWVDVLEEEVQVATHWSSVGAEDASDRVLMQWAERRGHVVLTHDLDFSAILAATQATGPSVIQVRTDDILPNASAEVVLRALQQFDAELVEGAVLSIDLEQVCVQYLPLGE